MVQGSNAVQALQQADLHEGQAEELCRAKALEAAPSPDIGVQHIGLILSGHALQHGPNIICCLEGLGIKLDDAVGNSLPGYPAL